MTQELKEVFTSNVDKRLYEAIIISHPLFSKTYYLVNDDESHVFDVDGTMQSFEVCPFRISLPEKGSAQQDVEVIMPNIGWDIIKELDDAIEDVHSPIMLRFLIYLQDIDTIQSEIPNLVFTNISVDQNSVSGVGMRKDLYAHYILENSAFDTRFEGLWL